MEKSQAFIEHLRQKQARGGIDEVSFMGVVCHTIRALAGEGMLPARAADALEAKIMNYLVR